MTVRGGFLWALGTVLIWAACAPRQTTQPAPPPTPAAPDTTQVPVAKEPVIIFEEEPTASVPKAEPSEEATPNARFLVQVFASRSKERAEIIASDLKQVQDFPVYVMFEDDLYKVRIGDFQTRKEAEGFRDYIRGRGYPDAFVVEMKR